MDPAPIVVAVDGSDGSLAAVRYAAEEAARVGCDLRVLHIAPSYLPIAGLVPTAGGVGIDQFEEVGREILEISAAPAYEILPKDRVMTVLELGYRTPGVLEAAKSARLLVVGDDRTSLLERLVVGRFVASVASRTPVPLVCVPANWTRPAGERRVVLALKDPQRIPPELVRAGFEAAADHGASLDIAHVYELLPGYGALATSMIDESRLDVMVKHAVRRVAMPLRNEFPDVSYTTTILYGQPAYALCERARDAELLILARRAHGFPFGHVGATGKAILREAPCPVEVLPIAERSAEGTMKAPRAPAEEPELTSAHR